MNDVMVIPAIEEAGDFFDTYRTPSIDSPPREDFEAADQRDAEQLELLKEEKAHEEAVTDHLNEHPNKCAFELKMTVKCDGGKPHTIPIAEGECPAERLEEYLEKRFNSPRFRNILRAIVGAPAPLMVIEEAGVPRGTEEEIAEESDDAVAAILADCAETDPDKMF